MLERKGIILKLSDKALDLLADLGYDPQFGARPMKRVLQKEVVNELSKMVLAGTYAVGDTIYVHTDHKGLTFSKEPSGKTEKAETPTPKAKEEKATPKKESNGNTSEDERAKMIEELKKATKDVEDEVKKFKKDKEDDKDNA